MRGTRSVWLDLKADGDVFVPDRRLGRSRRLIDGSLLLSHTLLPIELASSPSRSLAPSLLYSLASSSRLISSLATRLLSSHFSLHTSHFSLLVSCFPLPTVGRHLLLFPALSPLDSPVTPSRFGEGTPQSAVIVRVFAGPPINRIAVRGATLLLRTGTLSRVTSSSSYSRSPRL